MMCAGIFCVWPLLPGSCPDQVLGQPGLLDVDPGQGENVVPSCGESNVPDALVEFTAPSLGRYRVDLLNSSLPPNPPSEDYTLSVLDGCGGNELACNADFGDSLLPAIGLDLAAGETIIVDIEGDPGPAIVNIEGPLAVVPGGTCCAEHAGTGCDVVSVQDCVCGFDTDCCDTLWSADCAQMTAYCLAECP